MSGQGRQGCYMYIIFSVVLSPNVLVWAELISKGHRPFGVIQLKKHEQKWETRVWHAEKRTPANGNHTGQPPCLGRSQQGGC